MHYSPGSGFFYAAGSDLPLDAMPVTAARHAELMDGQATGKRIVTGPGGHPVLVDPVTPDPTLGDAERERDRRIAAGTTVTVTGITGGIPIKGRGADRDNISGLATIALARMAASDTTTIRFRDTAGTRHNLTPAQTMQMFAGGAAYIEAVHAVVWDWDDNGPVPADFTDDKHWP